MDKTYTLIPDFMLDYDLTLTETVALAVIYGFCQDGESDFHGSYSYLARKCKVTKSWAIKTVNSLIEKGYITKEVIEKRGVKFCSFRTVFGGGVENTLPVNKIHRGSVENTPGGGVENTPNNISTQNININNNKYTRFDFFAALKGIGVSDEVARAWMQVRKTKRATNTKIAFDRVKSEIEKSGRTADDCIRYAVEKSWQGFNATWLPATARKYESFEETMARLGIK